MAFPDAPSPGYQVSQLASNSLLTLGALRRIADMCLLSWDSVLFDECDSSLVVLRMRMDPQVLDEIPALPRVRFRALPRSRQLREEMKR